MSDVDEVRLAADRYRRYREGDYRPYEMPTDRHEIDMDRLQMDRHYLADAYLDSRAAVAGLVAAAKRLIESGCAGDSDFGETVWEAAVAQAEDALAAVREG
jgi:hypothetical protein